MINKSKYNNFIERIFSYDEKANKEAIIAIAKLIRKEHLTESNVFIFQKILSFNIKEASDIIFEKKKPENFFSVIQPSKKLIIESIDILIKYSPKDLYYLNLLSLLGILQNAYKNPKSGFAIYQLTVSDLDHIGKYLIINEKKINNMILDILNKIWEISHTEYKDVSIIAKKIIDNFLIVPKNYQI